MAMTNNNNGGVPATIQHQMYYCPGLHDPTAKHSVFVQTFEKFFTARPSETGGPADAEQWSILVPIFQRKYCWKKKQFSQLWDDMVSPPSDHSMGRIIISPPSEIEAQRSTLGAEASESANYDGGLFGCPPAHLVCVDGQQRLTTSLIIMSAVRDAALDALFELVTSAEESAAGGGDTEMTDAATNDAASSSTTATTTTTATAATAATAAALENDPVAQSLAGVVATANRFLFTNPAAAEAWAASQRDRPADSPPNYSDAVIANFIRLIPSHLDRGPFLEAALGGLIYSREPGAVETRWVADASLDENISYGKAFFDAKLAAAVPAGSGPAGVADVTARFAAAVARLKLVQFRLASVDYLQQVFVWLQERSMLGDVLVFNRAPGVKFVGADLARNWLLSFKMNCPLAEQHAALADWHQLEHEVGGPVALDVVLRAFTAAEAKAALERGESGVHTDSTGTPVFRSESADALNAPILMKSDPDITRNVMAYYRFVAMVEHRIAIASAVRNAAAAPDLDGPAGSAGEKPHYETIVFDKPVTGVGHLDDEEMTEADAADAQFLASFTDAIISELRAFAASRPAVDSDGFLPPQPRSS